MIEIDLIQPWQDGLILIINLTCKSLFYILM